MIDRLSPGCCCESESQSSSSSSSLSSSFPSSSSYSSSSYSSSQPSSSISSSSSSCLCDDAVPILKATYEGHSHYWEQYSAYLGGIHPDCIPDPPPYAGYRSRISERYHSDPPGVFLFNKTEYVGDFGGCFSIYRTTDGTDCLDLLDGTIANYYILGFINRDRYPVPDCTGPYQRFLCAYGTLEQDGVTVATQATDPFGPLGPYQSRGDDFFATATIANPICTPDGWRIPEKVCESEKLSAWGEIPNGMAVYDECVPLNTILPPYYVDWRYVCYEWSLCLEWVFP